MLVRNLLGGELVEDVIVGHPQRVLVAEVDLVLAQVALALGILDLKARLLHRQADRANHVLDHRRAEDRVVHVVRVGGLHVPVALLARRVVRLTEQHELKLGANFGVPAACGEPVKLCAQDLPRRFDHRRAVVVLHIGEAQRRALEPRHRAERGQVGLEHEVAVARLPAGEREARQRGHFHVDGEEVVAGLSAMGRDVVHECFGIEALALQAPLHIGHRQDDGIDLALGN